MTPFLQQAEDILTTASHAGQNDTALVILLDRQNGIRILDAAGWSMPALSAEFGASTIFKVEKRPGTTTVEGRSGPDRCLIERQTNHVPPAYASLMSAACHPTRLQTEPLMLAE